MSTQQTETPDVVVDQGEWTNEVRLVGRLAAEPQARELANGETVWLVKVSVPRGPVRRGKQAGDLVECAVWEPRLQRAVAKRKEGDVVEVEGAVRRRFFRAAGVTASRVEVEVSRFRVSRRARSG